jgi:hypothetical protein
MSLDVKLRFTNADPVRDSSLKQTVQAVYKDIDLLIKFIAPSTMATSHSPTATVYPLYGHPPGNTTTPNQAENTHSTWPWSIYLIDILVILLVILTCVAIGVGVCMWHKQTRIMKEAQRLRELDAAKRGHAGIGDGATEDGTTNHKPQILRKESGSSTAIITQLNPALLVNVWDIDAELSEDGSSWRVNTIRAWVNDIPDGMCPDMADLQTQLLRARHYEKLWMVRGRRLTVPKVTLCRT